MGCLRDSNAFAKRFLSPKKNEQKFGAVYCSVEKMRVLGVFELIVLGKRWVREHPEPMRERLRSG